MVWSIQVNWNCKVIMDIQSISMYDQKWFDSLTGIGIQTPTLREGTFPESYYWIWGN